jgi:hypothetical protein
MLSELIHVTLQLQCRVELISRIAAYPHQQLISSDSENIDWYSKHRQIYTSICAALTGTPTALPSPIAFCRLKPRAS